MGWVYPGIGLPGDGWVYPGFGYMVATCDVCLEGLNFWSGCSRCKMLLKGILLHIPSNLFNNSLHGVHR